MSTPKHDAGFGLISGATFIGTVIGGRLIQFVASLNGFQQYIIVETTIANQMVFVTTAVELAAPRLFQFQGSGLPDGLYILDTRAPQAPQSLGAYFGVIGTDFVFNALVAVPEMLAFRTALNGGVAPPP